MEKGRCDIIHPGHRALFSEEFSPIKVTLSNDLGMISCLRY